MALWNLAAPALKRRALPWTALGISGYAVQLIGNAELVAFSTSVALMALVALPVGILAWRRSRLRIMLPDGRVVTVRPDHSRDVELDVEPGGTWALRLTAGDESTRMTGTAATHSLRGILTAANFFGGPRQEIDAAVSLLQDSGDARRYLSRVAEATRATGCGNVTLLPPEVSLALEMALHDAAERRAMEGELTQLREEWELADQIARIADDMFLPSGLIQRLRRLKDVASTP